MPVRQYQLDIDTLYVHTWQNIQKSIVDNIFKSNPFWAYMQSKGRSESYTGGKWIEVPLEYADSSATVAWIGRTHDLSTQVNNAKTVDPVTSCQYPWRYVTATIYRYFIDDSQNRGKAALFNIVNTKLNNARRTLEKTFESTLFTLTDPGADNRINGLPNIVRDDPNPAGSTYTVGEITNGQNNNVWWNNKAKDMTGLDSTLNLVPEMRTMFNNCSDGNEHPDLILTNQTIFEMYEDNCLEYMQIVNERKGDLSFDTLYFKGIPMMWSPSANAGKMYFLNSQYLKWQYDPEINFEMTNWKEGRNDFDRVASIITGGNLTCSNRSKQGVMFNIG